MEKAVLSDPNIYPSDAILFSHLGKAKPAFVALFEFNHSAHPDFEEKWRYYNDGKRSSQCVKKKEDSFLAFCMG